MKSTLLRLSAPFLGLSVGLPTGSALSCCQLLGVLPSRAIVLLQSRRFFTGLLFSTLTPLVDFPERARPHQCPSGLGSGSGFPGLAS